VSDDLAAMYAFVNDGGYDADIAKLRTHHRALRSLREWASDIGWALPPDSPTASVA